MSLPLIYPVFDNGMKCLNLNMAIIFEFRQINYLKQSAGQEFRNETL